jgi:hypothetical protein
MALEAECRANRPYRAGRSKDWIRVKNRNHQAMKSGDGLVLTPHPAVNPWLTTQHHKTFD